MPGSQILMTLSETMITQIHPFLPTILLISKSDAVRVQIPLLDTRGNELVEFCISNQIRMSNGRVLGDLCGNYTCYTANGTSIVDYTLVSESILDQILYFNVNNFIPTISDCHCIIEWSMSAKCTTNIIADEVRLYDKGNTFIWSDDSTAEFQATFLSLDIQKKIENLKNKDINNSQILVS
jgi:hypothetical protein